MHNTHKTKLVGVTFEGRQGILASLQRMNATPALKVVREPANIYDPNAVAYVLGQKTVGYMDKEFAALLAPVMDEQGLALKAQVTAITQDADTRTLGCNVELWAEDGFDVSSVNPRFIAATGMAVR